MARHRTDPKFVTLTFDVREVREVVDVDQHLWAGETELHHRDEAVTARDEPRLRPVALELGNRIVDRGGALVLNWRGHLHGSPLRRVSR